MRPSQIKEVLKKQFVNQTPIFLWGPPGVGKSQVVAQVAAELGVQFLDVRLNLLDPVDLKGFPMPDAKRGVMHWLPADFLPTEGTGVLFLDEMNSAPHSVQIAAYSLVLDRKIGNYELPEGWTIWAAGNRESDRSGAQRMHAALANRFKHIEYEVEVEDWTAWARNNGVHEDLLSFIRFRPGLLHNFDPAERAFPTPRSWMMLNKDLHIGLTAETEFEVYKGTVGSGAAGEFTAFIRQIKDMPSIDEILLAPEKIKVPEKPEVLYAVTTALGMRAEAANFPTMLKFAQRMPTEFQVVFIRDAINQDFNITKLKEFTAWGAKNGNVLL